MLASKRGYDMKTMFILFVFVPSLAFAGEVADLFEKQMNNVEDSVYYSRVSEAVTSDDNGITEIGLERTTCYGTCPAYAVIIKKNGKFRYTGYKYVDKLGEHTGTVEGWELRNLLKFINDSQYDSLKYFYRSMMLDDAGVYTMVKKIDKFKVISNYANSGPTKLWAIEQLIDKLILTAKWD